MRNGSRPPGRRLVPALLALGALALAGCFDPFSPRVSSQLVASVPAPTPNSPQNVVKLFAWCWINRDPARYQEVFTDDYRFIFAPNDSAGNPFRDQPWLREDEMSMAQHLFVGGTDRPPASNITVTLDNNLLPTLDPRPGKPFTWHRVIRTSVDVKVTITDNSGTPSVQPIVGYAVFYLIRGDSAVIPADLVQQGFRPDSTRWWMERWEDQTAGATMAASLRRALGGPAGARPATALDDTPPLVLPEVTFGWLKAAYR